MRLSEVFNMHLIDNKIIDNLKPRIIFEVENGEWFLETTSDEMNKKTPINFDLVRRINEARAISRAEASEALKEIL